MLAQAKLIGLWAAKRTVKALAGGRCPVCDGNGTVLKANCLGCSGKGTSEGFRAQAGVVTLPWREGAMRRWCLMAANTASTFLSWFITARHLLACGQSPRQWSKYQPAFALAVIFAWLPCSNRAEHFFQQLIPAASTIT